MLSLIAVIEAGKSYDKILEVYAAEKIKKLGVGNDKMGSDGLRYCATPVVSIAAAPALRARSGPSHPRVALPP